MASQWYVHSGADVFGPWSASRIRDELRAGRIDAFDLASAEGSSLRRPLVEIDEIFEASGVQAAAIISDVIDQPSVNDEIRNAASPAESTGDLEREKPRAFEALAAPQRIKAPASSLNVPRGHGSGSRHGRGLGQAGRKSYLILLPGAGPRGPFTSKDVLILWYAKRLAVGTYIQRVGDAKRIEISRFASFYERAAPSGMAFIGQASIAHSAKDRSLIWLILAIFLAIGILVGAVYWRIHRLPIALIAPAGATIEVAPDGGTPTDNVAIQPAESPSKMPAAERQSQTLPAKSTVLSVSKSIADAKSASKVDSAKRAKPRVSKRVTKPAVRRPAPNHNVPESARPQVALPSNTAPPQKSTSGGWSDGAAVTLSGYSFNVALLNACAMKCKIPMSGPKGPVTAVFFKEAIGAGLAAKARDVTLTGTVRKDPATGGILIFVRGFR